MATYRQLHESLNLSEEKRKPAHKPGDVWQTPKTATGGGMEMRKDKDTEMRVKAMGQKVKKKLMYMQKVVILTK